MRDYSDRGASSLTDFKKQLNDLRTRLEQKERERARLALQAAFNNKKNADRSSLSQYFFTIDTEGQLHNFDAGFASLFGIENEEIEHRPLTQLLDHKTGSAFRQLIQKAVDNKEVVGKELPLSNIDDDRIPYCFMTRLELPNADEQHLAGLIAPIDRSNAILPEPTNSIVSGESKNEEQLRLQSAALDATALAMVITDVQGNIEWANPAFTKLTGYSQQEVRGKTPRVLKSGEQSKAFYEDLWKTILSGDVWSGELVNQRSDDQLYREFQTITPVRNDDEEITHFVSIKQDITDRKKIEELRKSSNRILEMIAMNQDLDTILEALVVMVENQIPEVKSSIMLVNEDGNFLNHAVSISLPPKYTKAIEGAPISPNTGSCGAAAFKGEAVFTKNIITDPKWENYRDIALKHRLQACWSNPIRSTDNKILGTFAFYWEKPNPLISDKKEIMEAVSHLASIAIRQHRVNRELRQQKKLLNAINSNVSEGIFRINTQGKIIYLNGAMAELLGFDHPDDCRDLSILNFLYRPHQRDRIVHLLKKHGDIQNIEAEFYRDDGTTFWGLINANLVEFEDSERYYIDGVINDISERKEHEQQEKRKYKRLERQQDLLLRFAKAQSVLDGEIPTVSAHIAQEAAHILQVERVSVWCYNAAEELMEPVSVYHLSSDSYRDGEPLSLADYPQYKEALYTGRSIQAMSAIDHPQTAELTDHYFIPHNISSVLEAPILKSGKLEGVISFEHRGANRNWEIDEIRFASELADLLALTAINKERKADEEQIRHSLEEKKVLLAEIHHRVKNNLAVISGMIDLQLMSMDNEEARNTLLESRSRIHSLALVHEKLYQSERLSQVNLKQYIGELLNIIAPTYMDNHKDIRIEQHMDDVQLNINQAIPCGLMINELLTNALKHAFHELEEGIIDIKVRSEDGNKLLLSVADNGIGLPDDFDPETTESLGMSIIQQLLLQLEGDIRFENNGGAAFHIKFPIKDELA